MDYLKNKPVFKCSNPNASAECRKLMAFFESIYGKKIITCQHTSINSTAEFERIKEVTGKYPAMIGIELMYIGRGAKPFLNQEGEMKDNVGSADMGIEWAKKHGSLVTATWHWHSPSHYHRSHSFYNRFTDFDFTKAMEERGEDFQYLIEDIDAVAEELKKFQRENIPVLWRPLHEGHGQHFWWGYAPKAYKELYSIMYDRLTNRHGLDNLIWVWECEETPYYPGYDRVDISGIDTYIYTKNSGTMSEEYEHLFAVSDGQKPLAITESGTVPDIQKLSEEKVPWLWHMLWYRFVDNKDRNDHETIKGFYNHPYVLTEDTFNEEYKKFTI